MRGEMAIVGDLSKSGLRVHCENGAIVGDEIQLLFEGYEPLTGRIIWSSRGEIGIELPIDALELHEI
jgi:hypothetical protein